MRNSQHRTLRKHLRHNRPHLLLTRDINLTRCLVYKHQLPACLTVVHNRPSQGNQLLLTVGQADVLNSGIEPAAL